MGIIITIAHVQIYNPYYLTLALNSSCNVTPNHLLRAESNNFCKWLDDPQRNHIFVVGVWINLDVKSTVHVFFRANAGKLKHWDMIMLFCRTVCVSVILTTKKYFWCNRAGVSQDFFSNTHKHKCPGDYPTPLADCVIFLDGLFLWNNQFIADTIILGEKWLVWRHCNWLFGFHPCNKYQWSAWGVDAFRIRSIIVSEDGWALPFFISLHYARFYLIFLPPSFCLLHFPLFLFAITQMFFPHLSGTRSLKV